MEETALRQTPLLQEHKTQGAKLAPFGGWLMPIQYKGIIAEHNYTRSSASLFDICHMGEIIIYGDALKIGLEDIITFNLSKMDLSACHYGFMLNKDGGIIDDLIVYRIEQEKWMLVVNAATTDRDLLHLKKNLKDDARMEDISKDIAKLDLQGPFSKEVLNRLVDTNISNLKYYSFGIFPLLGEEATISRTGYTGELGYEIYISSGKAKELWELLLEDKAVEPAGLGARDTLRLEMGYPLYGQDLGIDITPLEAGLEYFVDLDKEFIGRDVLLKQKEEGLLRKCICFKTGTRRAPRHNDKIFSEGKEVGIVTSGSFSPSLSCGIGMGYVENGYDWIGQKIAIQGERSQLEAEVTDKPFYREGTARK